MLLAPGALHQKGDWEQLKAETSHSHLNLQSDPSPWAAEWKRGAEKSPIAGLRAGKELGGMAVFCTPRAL